MPFRLTAVLLALLTVTQTPAAGPVPALNPSDVPAGELRELAAQVAAAQTRHASNASVLYYVAAVHARAGHVRQALDALRAMADLDAGLQPRPRDGFESLRGNEVYEAIVEGIRRRNPPVLRARVAFELPEADLVPEGIAWSKLTGLLYLGSVKRKILAVSRDGAVSEFVPAGSGGLGTVGGIRIDDERGELWAASLSLDAAAPGTVVGAFCFRLSDGRLLGSYPVPNRLNDLAVAPDGMVYGTATDTGALFRIDPAAGTVSEFLPAGTLPDPNGIAITRDGRYAFVAGWYGITRVELGTKATMLLETPAHIAVGCLDGLYVSGARELIGVQNCVHETGRIVRLTLAPGLGRVQSLEVLESYNPLFDGITTAAIAGSDLFFVANVQFRKMRPGSAPFQPLQVLRLPLR
jgi:sugar lactone lactonase YvrE